MSIFTAFLNLLKKNPVSEGTDTFNIETMLNDNWDKIDIGVKAVSDELDAHQTDADPHTVYIKKSLATAANDFLVASGAGVFVKKTLAEVKTILGLGSAAYTASTAYATAAQGTKADNAATQASLDAHTADYVRQPGYAAATGAANTYAVTLNPAPTAYINGMGLSVAINIANTGASTINVNGLGAKGIIDSKGSAMTAGKLKAGSIYSLRLNGSNFILQGEGGSGNAVASDLLSGKTASVDAGDIVGIMTDRTGTWNLANLVEAESGRIKARFPGGFYPGDGNDRVVLDDVDFAPPNFLATKNIFGLQGAIPVINPTIGGDQIDALGASPSSGVLCLQVPINSYLNGVNWVRRADANFIASNIKKDVNIFGIAGTYLSGVTAGTAITLYSNATVDTTNSTVPVLKRTTTALIDGTFRVLFQIKEYNYTTNARGQIYVNGVARGILRSSGTSGYTAFTEDITVKAGDLIQVYIWVTNSAYTAEYYGPVITIGALLS